MIQKEVLHGGRKGKILKEEGIVIRPGNKWTSYVQSFLSPSGNLRRNMFSLMIT